MKYATNEERKAARINYSKKYREDPSNREAQRIRMKEYNSSPARREHLRQYAKKYRSNPVRIEARRQYALDPVNIESKRRYYSKPETKEAGRWYSVKSVYGLDKIAHEKMLESQGGACAICEGVNANGRSLFVDHDHKTGKVRAFLCQGCNSGLGYFKENIERMKLAIAYLEKHSTQTPQPQSL